jgi:hypothetical protein
MMISMHIKDTKNESSVKEVHGKDYAGGLSAFFITKDQNGLAYRIYYGQRASKRGVVFEMSHME